MEHVVNIPIQMIASCTTTGEFMPIRFRYEAADCELVTVHIDQVLNQDGRAFGNMREMIYSCRATMFGQCRTFQVRYLIHEHRWFLYKI